MKRIWLSIRNLADNICFGMKITLKSSAKYFIIKCIILLCTAITPIVSSWLWKEVLNGLTYKTIPVERWICYVGIYISIELGLKLLAHGNTYIESRYKEKINRYVRNIIIDKTSQMELACYDSAVIRDKVYRAEGNFRAMADNTWVVFNTVSKIINIGIAFLVVCSFKWWIAVITLILLVPTVVYNRRYANQVLEREREQVRDNRKMDYCSDIFFENDEQFEIKVNNTGDYFISKYKCIWEKLFRINQYAEIKHNIINTLMSLLKVASEIFVLFISAAEVLQNKIGIGDLQYNLSMVIRLREQTSDLMNDIVNLLTGNDRLEELRTFLDIQSEREKCGTKIPSPHPKIEFKHVSFRYPNSDQDILKDCSFVIEPHEKIGLIGLNGAGKSTIIKLMLRLYDPSEGVICLDGTDIKEYDIYAVRNIFGILFQEYVAYCLPVREIIALSDFKNRYDDEKLNRACEISGANKIIEKWPEGFESVLGRHYSDDGKDLSGGQWQLVSLARAYFKDSDYMILDEPSAALDPISEDRIFEKLYHLSEGKGAVTISHRLSNTTLADKILVLGDGHVGKISDFFCDLHICFFIPLYLIHRQCNQNLKVHIFHPFKSSEQPNHRLLTLFSDISFSLLNCFRPVCISLCYLQQIDAVLRSEHHTPLRLCADFHHRRCPADAGILMNICGHTDPDRHDELSLDLDFILHFFTFLHIDSIAVLIISAINLAFSICTSVGTSCFPPTSTTVPCSSKFGIYGNIASTHCFSSSVSGSSDIPSVIYSFRQVSLDRSSSESMMCCLRFVSVDAKMSSFVVTARIIDSFFFHPLTQALTIISASVTEE